MLTKTLDFSLETKSVDDAGTFEGYASTFGNVDQVGDMVEAGAFGESLAKNKKDGRIIPMLWDHDPGQPIGIWLDLAEDAKGLWVKGELLIEADGRAKTTHALLKRKAITGLSIGYRIPAGGMEQDEKKPGVYRLKKIDLREVSLVAMPANLQAKVTQVKSALFDGGVLPTVREFEHWLRDVAGCSKSLATAIASRAAPVLRGEPEAKAVEAVDFLAAFSRALKAG